MTHDWEHVGWGYSGALTGRNKPEMVPLHNIGPIPPGLYDIGEPRNTPSHGPYVLPLTAHPENDMHGRSAFLIHGDSIAAPGTASQGCIILNRIVRTKIHESGDKLLRVVSGTAP
jgi:hypothetical protein